MYSEVFRTSFLAFWLKAGVSVDHHFISVEQPSTALLLIPTGRSEEKMGLNQISSASIHRSFKFRFGIVSLALALISLFVSGMIFVDPTSGTIFQRIRFALPNFLFALLIFLNALRITLVIERSGGQTTLNFAFYEKDKAIRISENINAALSGHLDSRDLGRYFDQK